MNTPTRRAAYARADKVEPVEAGPKVVTSQPPSPISVQLIMAVVAMAAIGFAVWSFFTNRQSLERVSATSELLFATRDEDPERYRIIQSEYQGTAAGQWAAAAQADLYLNQGIDALYVDRDEASTLLKSAVDTYRKLVAANIGGLLETRVRFGLAQALEANGDLDAAVTEYKALGEHRDASKGLKEVASERAKGIDGKDIRDFYAWFKAQSPKPSSSPAASQPPTLDGLPSNPDISIPKFPPSGTPPAATENNAAIPATTPESSTPATTTPATAAPDTSESKVPLVPPEDAEKPTPPNP